MDADRGIQPVTNIGGSTLRRLATTLSRDKPGGRITCGKLLHIGFTFNALPGDRISPADAAPFRRVDDRGEFFIDSEPRGLFQGLPLCFSLNNYDENDLVITLHNRRLFRPDRTTVPREPWK